MSNQEQVPAGYMKDRNDRLVKVENISELELFRHEFVVEVAEKALKAAADLDYLRKTIVQGIEDLAAVSAERYGAKLGGAKGNIQLLSYDGQFKVVMAVEKYPVLDERVQLVRAILHNCLDRFSEGGRQEAKAIFDAAFEAGRDGMVSISRLRLLRDARIEDEEWQEGIALLNELLKGTLEKSYVRVYKRNDAGKYEQIQLGMGGE